MTIDDQDAIRRRINLRLATRCAEVGLYVCPAANKTPLIPDWTRPDTLAADDTRNARIAKWKAKHGKAPPHVGCTTDVQAVKKLWNLYPDAVPLISLGPSGLLVLDPDRKNEGPQKIGRLFKEHGFSAKGCPVTKTRDGGRHIFFRNTILHGNTEGAFSDYGTNVKGIGGQVIAPGTIREDGKRYVADPNYPSLFDAFASDTLPDVPQFIIGMLKRGGTEKTQVGDKDEARAVAGLEAGDWPDADAIRDPLLGYDVDHLRRVDANFEGVLANPHSDMSKNRLAYANALLREWPHMSVTDYAALVTTLEGAGTPNYEYAKAHPGDASNRELAREYLKAKAYAKARPASAGVSATADEEIGEAPAENAAAIRALRTLKGDLALGLLDVKTYDDRRKRVVSAARDTGRAVRERIAEIKRLAGIETFDDDEKDDEREPAKQTRRGVSVSELSAKGFKPVEYLWHDLLAANTVTMIYGHAGASKTSLVINEAMPHAFGFDREGNAIERFGTIFIALESVDDTHNLILAWLCANPQYRTFGTEAAFTVVNGVGWGLHDRQLKKTELERHLEKEIKEFPQRFGVQPRVVVIDTAAMAVISDSGEESNECVNRTLSAANRVLSKMTRGAIVFLGHTGKDEKTYRGAVSWLQGTQGFVRMERRGGRVMVSVERLKGAASGARFTCQSNAVPMGVADSLGRDAVAYVLTARSCTSNPNVPSNGGALTATDDEGGDAAPILAEQQEAPALTLDERKAQEIAALADEACAVLATIGRPLKRTEWDAEIQAKRLEGVKGRKKRERISGPPERKMDRAIGRLIAERRIRRAGSARATLYELTR